MRWPSRRCRLITKALGALERPALARMTDVQAARRRVSRVTPFFTRPPRGVQFENETIAGIPCERVSPSMTPTNTLLYLHGGAYAFGTPRTFRPITGALAKLLNWEVIVPAYRLAPEHPYPAATQDVRAVYDDLENVAAIAGDSAGGGLSFSLLLDLLESGGRLPRAVAAFSPWLDLTGSSESYRTNDATEVIIPPERLPALAAQYGGTDLTNPHISPIFGTFKSAPPCLIQLSNTEIFYGEGKEMAQRLYSQGAEVELQTWPSAPHVWHMFRGLMPEADHALERAATFLREHQAA